MHFIKTMKNTALAGLVGLGIAAATTTAADADRVYTRCDAGRCWKVVCDWDDCRRIPIRWSSYADRRYSDRDPERFYRHHHFDRRIGVWVCDGSSEYCRWSARRW